MSLLGGLLNKLYMFRSISVQKSAGILEFNEVRMAFIPSSMLAETRDRLIGIGPAAQRFMYEAGKSAGKEYAVAVDEVYGPKTEKQFVRVCEDFGALGGWGRPEVVKADFEQDEFVIHQINPIFHPASDEPEKTCEYTAGMVAGAAQHILGTEMDVKETACSNEGNEHCVFEVRPAEEYISLFSN